MDEKKYFEDEDEENKNYTLVENLKKAYISEIFSPTIFKFKTNEVNYLLSKIQEKADEIFTGVESKSEKNLKNSIIQLEIERIKYLICSYLKVRLRKVKKKN
jgi:hypothetical protein